MTDSLISIIKGGASFNMVHTPLLIFHLLAEIDYIWSFLTFSPSVVFLESIGYFIFFLEKTYSSNMNIIPGYAQSFKLESSSLPTKA